MPAACLGASHLHKMAVCGGEGVRGVHELGHLSLVYMKHPLQHPCHLFLRSSSVAGQSHFYLQRSVLVDRDVALDGSGDGDALRTAELQHGLDVMAEERGLDGELVGKILFYDARHALENVAQLEIRVAHLAHVYDAHAYQRSLVARDLYGAVAHDVRAGVYAQDNLFRGIHLMYGVASCLERVNGPGMGCGLPRSQVQYEGRGRDRLSRHPATG